MCAEVRFNPSARVVVLPMIGIRQSEPFSFIQRAMRPVAPLFFATELLTRDPTYPVQSITEVLRVEFCQRDVGRT